MLAEKKRKGSSPGTVAFYLGILLLTVEFGTIFCSIFLDPSLLTRLPKLVSEELEEQIGASAEIMGHIVQAFLFVMMGLIAFKIANYGIRMSEAAR